MKKLTDRGTQSRKVKIRDSLEITLDGREWVCARCKVMFERDEEVIEEREQGQKYWRLRCPLSHKKFFGLIKTPCRRYIYQMSLTDIKDEFIFLNS